MVSVVIRITLLPAPETDPAKSRDAALWLSSGLSSGTNDHVSGRALCGEARPCGVGALPVVKPARLFGPVGVVKRLGQFAGNSRHRKKNTVGDRRPS